MKNVVATFFLLIALCNVAQTSDRPNYRGYQSQYAISHWTTSNGLPQSHVSGIAQTPDKLIWIATYAGIVRFDGRKFMPLQVNEHKHRFSTFVTTISAYGDTLVWASPQEIVYYHKHRILSVYPLKEKNTFIIGIRSYRRTHFFIGHESVQYRFRQKLHTLFSRKDYHEINQGTILTTIFHANRMWVLLRNPDGKTWLFTYDFVTKKRTLIQTDEPYANLVLYNGTPAVLAGNQWKVLQTDLHTGQTLASFAPNGTEKLLQSGIENGLLFYYTREHLLLQREDGSAHLAQLETSQIMYGNELFVSFRDHAGNLWLGTNSMGLFFFRYYPFTVFHYLKADPVTNSSHAFIDSENLLWFDSDCNTTVGMQMQTGTVAHKLKDVCNWTIAQWSKDSLALFAFGYSHYWYNKRNHSLTVIPGIHTAITNFHQLAPRSFILAGEGTLYKWNGGKLKPWKRFHSRKTTCNQIYRLNPDDIYFATSEGLYRYHNSKWSLFTGRALVESPDFRSLFKVPDSPYLLIGTEHSGILRYHTGNGSAVSLPQIPSQLHSCWSMVEDRNHHLWITSNNGIVEVSLKELLHCFSKKQDYLTLNHYQYENGLENVEFNSRTENKGALLPDGRILFSGLGGPVLINPDNDRSKSCELGELLIEKVTVDQQTLSGPYPVLAMRQGQLMNVYFTLPSFASERVLGFEYRIVGYRDHWSPVLNRNIMLDNLPSGEYQLEIRSNGHERQLQIPVSIASPHPNWWIAQLIFIIVTVTAIILTTIYFTKRNQQKKHALAGLKQQLKLLEMEALRSQMNPHFIFNCLNTIQFLFISGNVARANKYLTNFSALMRMFLDLLREPITTLDLELKATELYIELEQLQFDHGFEYRLINNLRTSPNQIRVPSLFFQVFVENAVLHGLRKTSEEIPTLTLILDETEDMFIFRICDNGPGMSQQKKGAHTSLGIQLLRDRFALKREIYNWHMHFSVKENESIQDHIKTEIIITFGKVLLQTSNNEYPDR